MGHRICHDFTAVSLGRFQNSRFVAYFCFSHAQQQLETEGEGEGELQLREHNSGTSGCLCSLCTITMDHISPVKSAAVCTLSQYEKTTIPDEGAILNPPLLRRTMTRVTWPLSQMSLSSCSFYCIALISGPASAQPTFTTASRYSETPCVAEKTAVRGTGLAWPVGHNQAVNLLETSKSGPAGSSTSISDWAVRKSETTVVVFFQCVRRSSVPGSSDPAPSTAISHPSQSRSAFSLRWQERLTIYLLWSCSGDTMIMMMAFR